MPHLVRPRSHHPQRIGGISCRAHFHCWCTLKNYHVNNKYKMELINYPTPRAAARDVLPTMATPMLPPLASSAMSAAKALAARTRAVAVKSRMAAAARGIPLPSPSPLLLPPPRSSLIQRLAVALMPPPLILLTLPPPLNSQPRPIEAPSPLVHWCLSSRLPLVHRLVVASPVVACLRLVSHFVRQPPHTSILNPSSLFMPAGCCVASLRTASAS